ncbi:hypothetical protein [Pediococcus argentinicus]|uniref:TPR repeat-containing protein n=1 Tax=Pediococcus argentinicus TaxID=480391 RepID=A0A0R2NII3_9LACO|nr:hypothetical protein [Pediococcus argentinicus]KRO25606.1 hypothetical protein IV88_GL001686 [Pediococcus argentinicus]NKZ22132.1 hypothetical protein [Pediococcus argentinicus]GEP19574.1 hypothetical protein LSA03_09580 [Pediococcus argentinicus]
MKSKNNQFQEIDPLIENGETSRAMELLEKLDRNDFNSEVVSRIVKIHLMNKQYQMALKRINEHSRWFSENQPTFYIETLIQAKSYVPAYQFLISIQENLKDSDYEALKKLLFQEMDLFKRNSKQTIIELKKSLYHIGNHNLIEQQRVLEQSFSLPIKEFEEAVKFALVDPFLNQFMRVTLLEQLVSLQSAEKVQFMWIDHNQYEVIPSELTIFNKDPLYRDIIHQLDNEIKNPSEVQQLKQSLEIYYRLSFPFETKINNSSTKWIESLTSENPDLQARGRLRILDEMLQDISNILK